MNRGQPPLEIGPAIYYAPSTDRGMAEQAGRLVTSEFTIPPDHYVNEGPAKSAATEFMDGLYGGNRYGPHTDRVLRLRDRYVLREPNTEDDREAIEISKLAVILDDIVDHTILNPDRTAARILKKTGREQTPEHIKTAGIDKVNEILDSGDRRNLIDGYLFAIDASKWEEGGRAWRKEASSKIEQLLESDDSDMEQYSADVLNAAIHKTAELDAIPQDELKRILNKWAHVFVDLKLQDIREETLRHNVEGLVLKGLETLENIENPPPNDPTAVWRDSIEAISFLAPALAILGFRDLAKDLRGVSLKCLFEDKYPPGDPIGAAARQFELSDQYFDDVHDIVLGLREEEFPYEEMDIEYRIKHEGSIRAKLASEDYEETYMVPDGIGFSLIMPDGMNHEAMVRFARRFSDRLVGGMEYITNEHPREGDEAFEEINRKNGYKAVHMTFFYHPEDGSGEPVPFEIQVLTRQKYKDKLYGPFSDLFYKYYGKGVSGRPGDEAHLNHFEKRGSAGRNLAPGVTIQSISEALARTGDRIPFVFSELFRAVDLADGQRVLIPPQLASLAHELSDELKEVFEGSDGLAVLPPTEVSEEQFKDSLRMLSRDLARDPTILKAMDLVKRSEAGMKLRKDGKTNTYKGHILPTAQAALMLAVQSGKIWESGKLSPSEYMSNIVQIAILHDHVEDMLEKTADVDSMLRKRKELLAEIRQDYGLDVMEGVDALTVPLEIEDQHERREQYRRNIQANGYARLIKPADRWQNHTTDLIQFLTERPEEGSALYKRFMEYFKKTDNHQSDDFMSPELAEVYNRVHAVIWKMAEHFGYKKPNND